MNCCVLYVILQKGYLYRIEWMKVDSNSGLADATVLCHFLPQDVKCFDQKSSHYRFVAQLNTELFDKGFESVAH